MDTNKWGKHGWIFLHYITFNYPDNPTQNDIDNYYTFFDSLKHTLPCNLCKVNYSNHLYKHSLLKGLKNKKSLIKWLIDIHNENNQLLNKPILSYEKALCKLDKCDNNNNIYYVLVILSIIFFLYKLKY